MSQPICNTKNCTAPAPEDMDDQSQCENCRQHVCIEHVVNRSGYSLCRNCYTKESEAALSIAREMNHFLARIVWSWPPSGRCVARPLSPADIQATLEGWLARIKEVC